ncbi:hypothetical protein MTO96_028203 [Rhipicephalus appendiculatus]
MPKETTSRPPLVAGKWRALVGIGANVSLKDSVLCWVASKAREQQALGAQPSIASPASIQGMRDALLLGPKHARRGHCARGYARDAWRHASPMREKHAADTPRAHTTCASLHRRHARRGVSGILVDRLAPVYAAW